MQNCALITQDTRVLQAVQGFKSQETHFPVEREKLATEEVAGLIQKGAISPVSINKYFQEVL